MNPVFYPDSRSRLVANVLTEEWNTLNAFLNGEFSEGNELPTSFFSSEDVSMRWAAGTIPISNSPFIAFEMYVPVSTPPPSSSSVETHEGLTAFEIDQFTSKEIVKELRECYICLETLLPGSCMHRLNSCGHLYCIDCIAPWIREHRTCPVCKANVCSE